MIQEKTFYGCKCDACGQFLPSEWDDAAYYDNEEFVEQLAKDSDWITARGKHYCPDCYHYGDNDELILADGTVIQFEDDDWV